MPTPTVEEYLEIIYTLASDGAEAIGARLAQALGVSPPTVTATLQRMARDGLVSFGPHKQVRLTEHGKEAVESLLRRHRLSERLLVDVLGLSWHEAHEEACRLEHAISPRVEEQLRRVLGEPKTCPHGNPIPGTAGDVAMQEQRRLVDVPPGDTVEICRVAKRAEEDASLLLYLAQHDLKPGTRIYVREVAPFNGPVILQVDGMDVPLSRDLAAILWVVPVSP
ncbi:MAG: metal-dependent transcriptional regulator [Chloroflexota bacterium]